MHVLAERAAIWLTSLSRLDRPTDYQAHSAACRALLELVVDVVLVASEPPPCERMWAWEESAKLKIMPALQGVRAEGEGEGAEYSEARLPRTKRADRPEPPKAALGNGQAPPTWFGKPFEQVTAEADRRANASRKVGHVETDYEATYAKNYDELCWGTHGSSLAMIRSTPPPEFLAALAMRALGESSRFALDLTERAADFLGLDGDAIGLEVFDKMKGVQDRYRAHLLSEIGAGGDGIPLPRVATSPARRGDS